MKEILYTLLMIALIVAAIGGIAAIMQLLYGSAYWEELADWLRFFWIMGGGC